MAIPVLNVVARGRGNRAGHGTIEHGTALVEPEHGGLESAVGREFSPRTDHRIEHVALSLRRALDGHEADADRRAETQDAHDTALSEVEDDRARCLGTHVDEVGGGKKRDTRRLRAHDHLVGALARAHRVTVTVLWLSP